ncbi:hypothetical protein [Jejuia spongiicola]|uniref:Lipocalin-like domain-containing protein n=1 Tax=Jejuia spongiicola TaxID=2942207 RepID=A0ABT0Q9W9_9FLAO|nr:hypothetical protein [Jejuia spongiicola]MCL6293777.1 hypothetical protein [Jejuia spongiicola]
MKRIIRLSTVTVLISIISFSCKAQQLIGTQQQINTYSIQIIGTWLDEEDNNYKLVFLTNGTCKEYENSELITTYNYSIVSSNCDDYSASNSIYLRWLDDEDSQISCLEILNITDDSLSLMIIDKAERLFFNKQ